MSKLHAQQGLLQKIQLNDYYRRLQLAGDSTISSSFSIGPYTPSFMQGTGKGSKDTFLIRSMIGMSIQNNSALPYGYNDESFLPAVGLQHRFTAGVQFETKNLYINIQPEWVNASNTAQNDLLPPPNNNLNNYWGKYFAMLGNRIDMPSRFGDTKISTIYPGQSAIRYQIAGLSAGISTENIWWGPARYNALISSNNAPGFLHATLKTTRPFVIPIGKIEAQFIFGKLNGSGVTPPEYDRIAQLGCPQCYEPPIDGKTRNISGYAFSFMPKGIENLSIGMAYASYRYADTTLQSSSLGSLFFRYSMPKDRAEIYAEYGRSDKLMGPFDMFKDSVPYGYTIGFRKLVATRKKGSFVSIAAEISHLGLPKAGLIFDRNNIWGPPNPNSYSWYTSAKIRHGYTNRGQVMGASIGPGSNSQTLNIALVSGQNQVGFQLQRVMRNTDFYYYNYFNGFIGGGNTDAFWVDISASLYGQWQYKQILFAGSIDYLSSINYYWLKLDGGFGEPSSLSDKRNFQLRLSAQYLIDWGRMKRH
ncbi:MAG: hypothetical protein IM581_01360 [Chitinophagaceae bacterium]|nr:hypothetical protein [Chitinophagaceae bacterium]